jgi:hypothetical protein|tara:strand:- start:51 stop:554 length:504 start_codon:yes stop_codon:yes gene_type:complete
MTVIKMDKPSLGILVATAALGIEASMEAIEYANEHDEASKTFVKTSKVTLNSVIEQFVENDRKVDLCDDDYLTILTSIRGAFDYFMIANEDRVQQLLNKAGASGHQLPTAGKIKMAVSAHAVLEFLECSANKDVSLRWQEIKKPLATMAFNRLAEQFGGFEDTVRDV